MRRLSALVLLLSVGCTASPKGNENAPPPATGDASPTPSAGNRLTGTVVEHIPAGGYRYLRLKTESGEVWAAVSDTPVESGATVTVANAMAMERFESKTLNRTFDRIYFGAIEGADGAIPETSGAPQVPGYSPHSAPSAPAASSGAPHPAMVTVGRIDRASGPDARTIGELWTQKGQLAGKTVSIRGVVVRYNPGVMGKNWMHLQDGSGDAVAETHDITVTSMDTTALGTTVTITGIVRVNRDFGSGYAYPLIVEDAKVVAK